MESSGVGFADRLRSAIEGRNLTMKAFSEEANIPYRSLLNYLSGSQLPGFDVLAKVRRTLGVDLNWLVTGEEQPAAAPADGENSLERAMASSTQEFAKALNLQELLALSSLSGSVSILNVHSVFMAAHPQPLSFTEVAERLRATSGTHVEDVQVVSAVLWLHRSGALSVTRGAEAVRYALNSPRLDKKSIDSPERHLHVVEGMKFLAQSVLPAMEEHRPGAYLSSGYSHAPKGEGAAEARQLRHTFREALSRLDKPGVKGEKVSFLLAIHVDDSEDE